MVYSILQLIVALGLLNVWLIRSNWATAYRGGEAKTLREEFSAYGLPGWSFYAVGLLKIGGAVALLAALWVPSLRQPAALLIVLLMAGAVTMHAKIKDPLSRAVPALAMLVMSLVIALA